MEGIDGEWSNWFYYLIHDGNSENRFVNFYLHVFVDDVKFLRS